MLFLLKSDPSDFSWSDMVKSISTRWDGVRNYQAISYLQKASLGDFAFFYLTGKLKSIMGVVRVISEFYVPEGDKFGCIDVEYYCTLKRCVSLQEIKSTPSLSGMSILKQPRLSVSEVTPAEWNILIEISNS